MSMTNEIHNFVSSLDAKFADGECNLTSNKLEYIHLVQEVEEHFGIEINDAKLNQITNVQDLIEEVILAIEA